jgi:hypothetical protein
VKALMDQIISAFPFFVYPIDTFFPEAPIMDRHRDAVHDWGNHLQVRCALTL